MWCGSINSPQHVCFRCITSWSAIARRTRYPHWGAHLPWWIWPLGACTRREGRGQTPWPCLEQEGSQEGGPALGSASPLRDSQSCRESWFLLTLSSQPEMGGTSRPFPCHRYVHGTEASCRWQAITSALFSELCPRLGLTSIAVSSLRVALRNKASSCCWHLLCHTIFPG